MQLAREIWTQHNIPIIVITAKADDARPGRRAAHGADDYIVKPFHIREVLMRARSVLRRYELESVAEDIGNSVVTFPRSALQI